MTEWNFEVLSLDGRSRQIRAQWYEVEGNAVQFYTKDDERAPVVVPILTIVLRPGDMIRRHPVGGSEV